MSQNDKLLIAKGLPVLTKAQKDQLRGEWQSQTWDDMILSLNSYGKYIMLRPTGFGKTYTCACACNIGAHAHEQGGAVILDSGTRITNEKIINIHKKKIIFVYVSDILKQTFEKYDEHAYKVDKKTGNYVYNEKGEKIIEKRSLIKHDSNDNSRIVYETYSMLAKHWDDRNYLLENMDINNVGLVIFDEVQRMGAQETAKALDIAIPILEELGIPYIGATATVERATGHDVCDKYFTYKHPDGRITYCWGEHIYTLGDTFRTGLIIPPEYQYIEEDQAKIKKARQTRLSIIQELKAVDANDPDRELNIKTMKDLQRAVIKNSSKIVHDTMLNLYDCNETLINNKEELDEVEKDRLPKPNKLPSYMRFLVFTPDRKSMTEIAKNGDTSLVFGGMVKTTVNDFRKAFERYGYRVRYTVISSYNKEEREAVKLIDPKHIRDENDIENEKAIIPRDMIIDLIFSINMLNVGYHVDNITGLIFKRWTGSNQIFYQQLGRCLSSVSDIIPVVFDFVKSIDSRGITAPLFTKDAIYKEVTENADGTQNINYKERKRSSKKNVCNNAFLMDENGNPIDPRKCNIIEAEYITVGMTSATIDEIESRCKVYQERKTSKELFNSAYNLYLSKLIVENNTLKYDKSKPIPVMPLYEALRLQIIDTYEEVYSTTKLSINYKAFLEYLKIQQKNVCVTYEALDNYVNNVSSGNKFGSIEHEVNSLLSMAKTSNNIGVTLNVLIRKDKLQDLKDNQAVKELLQSKGFNPKENIIFY